MDYWFYHLEHASLEAVLPQLLEKTRTKGWQALVKMSKERLPDMDRYLWTYRDDSFLPHGLDDEPLSDRQPICLSHLADESGRSQCVFLLDQTDIVFSEAAERCIIIIEGQRTESVAYERARWKALKDTNASMSYWQQDDRGDWKKKA
ncbi:MAG: DNA polymerase III subunit chi [Maricaulaceae bacterium]